MTTTRALPLVFATLFCALPCLAQEEALDQVVVRNRLFQVHDHFELSADASTALNSRLVDTYNFQAGIAYNLKESWAVEVRGGYAVSYHTSLANHVASDLMARNPNGPDGQVVEVNDLSGLWEMKGNLIGGVRWSPIYGKLSLWADQAVRFQTYLWLGGGVGSLHRQSVVYCSSASDGGCSEWLTENRTAPVASGAVGFRFFLTERTGFRAEVRDFAYQDSYRVNVDRSVAEAGGTTGTRATSPGIAQLVVVDVGFTFLL